MHALRRNRYGRIPVRAQVDVCLRGSVALRGTTYRADSLVGPASDRDPRVSHFFVILMDGCGATRRGACPRHGINEGSIDGA